MSIAHASSAPAEAKDNHARAGFWTLTLGSVGVVYGDIGTSPLYALQGKPARRGRGRRARRREMVLGVLSLILWALIVIVTLKYVLFIMRADNNGEGGTLALMALAPARHGRATSLAVTLLGMAGAALFYGDAMITPAISVLSAVEGLKLVDAGASSPTSCRSASRSWSACSRSRAAARRRSRRWFGPITAVWFVALALGGLVHIVDDPSILAALSPIHGVRFLVDARPRRASWRSAPSSWPSPAPRRSMPTWAISAAGRSRSPGSASCCPSLALNYLGQGALLLAQPESAREPVLPARSRLGAAAAGRARDGRDGHRQPGGDHRRLLADPAGDPARPPAAPRDPPHLGDREGPDLHAARSTGCCCSPSSCLVLVFRSSSALAVAYGIAVTGTMVITTAAGLRRHRGSCWSWPLWRRRRCVIAPFLAIDLVFLVANMLKIVEGGWLPLAVGAALMVVMLTWRRGTRILAEKAQQGRGAAGRVHRRCSRSSTPERVQGTAVFLTGRPGRRADRAAAQPQAQQGAARAQRHPERRDRGHAARRSRRERVTIERLSDQLHARDAALRLHGGAERAAARSPACRAKGMNFDVMRTSFFLSRRALRPGAAIRRCRAGRTGCSSGSPARRTTPAGISAFRADGRSRSGRRLRFEGRGEAPFRERSEAGWGMILDRLAAVPGRAAGAAHRRPSADRPEPGAAADPERPGAPARRLPPSSRFIIVARCCASSSAFAPSSSGFSRVIVGHHCPSSVGRRRAAGERANSSALRRKIPPDALGKPVARGYLARSQFSFKPPEVGAKPSFTT